MDPEELTDDPEDVVDATDEEWDEDDLVDGITEIPIHGVAAVEGKPTGDGRMFALDSLTTRELPLPARFEYSGAHGGDNSQVAVIGVIDEMWRQPGEGMNEYRYRGRVMLNSQYGPEVVEGIIDGRYKGVSIEADDITVDVSAQRDEMRERIKADQESLGAPKEVDDGGEPTLMTDEQIDELIDVFIGDGSTPLTTFSAARICGFTIVPIPAYAEAYVALGSEFPDELSDEAKTALAASGCNCEEMTVEDYEAAQAEFEELVTALLAEHDGFRDVSGKDRKKMAKDGTAMPDGSFPIANVDDLKNAIQSIGRAKDPAAAKAHIKKRAKALGQSDLIPDDWSALGQLIAAVATRSAERGGMQFAPGTHDGPGWITNPRATARIRRYWTRGKGAAKIRWGEPGDFNRCRKQLVKYVQNPDWLAGLCANMHKEAIGIWPGMEDGGRKGHDHHSAQLVLVAAAPKAYPKSWFTDPGFTEVTPITITDDGHIFGHAATWDTCHIGFADVCTTAPHSLTDYAYFRTGVIRTDDGDVPVGQITMGTGHAGIRLNAAAAVEHYDNTGTAVADVAAGEDAFGVWVNGAIRDLSEEQIRELMASSLSGDWRDRRGNLEMVALLAVNVPGFAVPRTSLAASGLDQTALVAAGVVQREQKPADEVTPEAIDGIFAASPAKVAQFMQRVADEMRAQEERRARLTALRTKQNQLRSMRLNRIRSKIITRED